MLQNMNFSMEESKNIITFVASNSTLSQIRRIKVARRGRENGVAKRTP